MRSLNVKQLIAECGNSEQRSGRGGFNKKLALTTNILSKPPLLADMLTNNKTEWQCAKSYNF
jgi:hypothetical protein